MKRTTRVLGTLAFLAAAGVRPNSQMPASHSAIEMNGVTPAMKLQVPVEGFMTALNGKIDLRASEVEFQPGGAVKDHYHFGPGIRRVLSGELTIVHVDTKKEQVVRAGEYFYESGDANIWAVNRGTEPAKLLIFELVPAGWKTSAMLPLDRRAEAETTGSRLKGLICSKD